MRSLLVVSVVVLSLVAAACGDDDEPVAFAGFERVPAPVVAEVELPEVDADGNETPYEFMAVDDGVLLVYFGYTSCPDVCPTTLSDVRSALDEVGDDAERVDLAMVTIDPDRDTPDILTGYVDFFLEGSAAVRTTDDPSLRAAADVFGVDYGVETNAEGEIEVFHTGSLYAVDDAGTLVLTWPFGVPADDLAADLDRLLDEA